MTEYFYDSYAIIEFLNGNAAYKRYFTGNGVTSLYNLLEVFYALLRIADLATARKAIRYLQPFLIDVAFEDIEPAMRFRKRHERKKLSYADCLGYTIAKRNGLLFLTGDKQFKHMRGVKFVR